ncbi:MAG: DUF805 domain-containing protein [Hyphomicrobiaceae bacterium]
MGLFNLFCSLQGRINRATWWLCGLVFFVLALILDAVFASMLAPSFPDRDAANVDTMAGGLRALILLYPMIAVGVKRLHDRNKSGWWIVAFMAPAFLLGLLLPVAVAGGSIANGGMVSILIVLTIVTIIMVIWNIVELGFLSGTTGDNDYGGSTKFAHYFGAGAATIEEESAWAKSINLTAAVAAAQPTAMSTSTPASPAMRKVAKPAATKPTGFGQRVRSAR